MKFFADITDAIFSFAATPTPNPTLLPIAITAGPPPAGLPEFQNLITRLISLSVPLAFIAVTVVLAIAGIKYLTSGGDSKAIGAAHGAVTWALLGIIFLALSWLILLLIEAFTGVKVTQFNLTFPGT